MSKRNAGGFTIAEVLVAVVMLTVGVMALVGSSAMVTRMVGRGRQDTMAGQAATSRLELLRQIAASTATPCTSAQWKTDSAVGGTVKERWEMIDNAGDARRVRLIVRYPVARRTAVDTIITTFLCK
jgi:Tfp pilus assembly protein PilV